MSLEVIGAGFGRTGTLSLKLALERLGYGSCYHMEEIVRQPERIGDWMAAARAPNPDWPNPDWPNPDWDAIFSGYRACTDWPAATYWRELAAYYPQAKVVLSVRDPQSWFESTQKTIFNPDLLAGLPPPFREMIDINVLSLFEGRIHDRDRCIEVYEQHIRAVSESLPAERLLLFRVSDGWNPLCTFLGCDVPADPFPRTNDAGEFRGRAGEMMDQQGGPPGAPG